LGHRPDSDPKESAVRRRKPDFFAQIWRRPEKNRALHINWEGTSYQLGRNLMFVDEHLVSSVQFPDVDGKKKSRAARARFSSPKNNFFFCKQEPAGERGTQRWTTEAFIASLPEKESGLRRFDKQPNTAISEHYNAV
jgi:hypothetical protein